MGESPPKPIPTPGRPMEIPPLPLEGADVGVAVEDDLVGLPFLPLPLLVDVEAEAEVTV